MGAAPFIRGEVVAATAAPVPVVELADVHWHMGSVVATPTAVMQPPSATPGSATKRTEQLEDSIFYSITRPGRYGTCLVNEDGVGSNSGFNVDGTVNDDDNFGSIGASDHHTV